MKELRELTDEDYAEAQRWMDKEREFKPPTPATVPAPGVYWLRTAMPTLEKYEKPEVKGAQWSTYSWRHHTVSEWFVASVHDGGYYDILGSDEGEIWLALNDVVVEVGPRIEPPPK